MRERLPGAPWAATREKLLLARAMRRSPTPAEQALWRALRGVALGFRFRRQHVIAGYIVDFYCPACRLAATVDGPIHRARHVADRERDGDLANLGVAVLRIDNANVQADLPAVLRRIVDLCRQRSPLPRLRGKGRRMGA